MKGRGIYRSVATATCTEPTLDEALNGAMRLANTFALNNAVLISANDAHKIALQQAINLSLTVEPKIINPFVPLTVKEQQNIVDYFSTNILADYTLPGDDLGNVLYDLLALKEAPKAEVLEFYNSGKLPERKAEVGIYYSELDKYELHTVLLQNENVVRIDDSKIIDKARPSYDNYTFAAVQTAILADESFRQVMMSKGLTSDDIDNNMYLDISCDSRVDILDKKYGEGFSDFIYKTNPRPRIYFATPFWNDGNTDTTSAYIQPIDCVLVFYDVISKRILKIYDSGTNNPISKGQLNWERPYEQNLKPLLNLMPEGPSYKVNQNEIQWGDWEFTWAAHPVYGNFF